MRGGGPTPNGKCHEKVFFGYPSYLHVQFTSRLEQDFVSSEPPAKPYGEPIYDLSNGNKADPKTKSAEAAKAGDEVQPGHLWGSLELWNALWYILETDTCGLTIDSWFSKEYVHNGNVFLVGVVKSHILKKIN